MKKLPEDIWLKIAPIIQECGEGYKRKYTSSEDPEKSDVLSQKKVIENVLYVVSEKEMFLSKMPWGKLGNDSKEHDAYRKRFERWRDAGIWEKILSIFIKFDVYNDIMKQGFYEVFFVNYKLLTIMNCKSELLKNNKEISQSKKIVRKYTTWLEKEKDDDTINKYKANIKLHERKIKELETKNAIYKKEIAKMDKKLYKDK